MQLLRIPFESVTALGDLAVDQPFSNGVPLVFAVTDLSSNGMILPTVHQSYNFTFMQRTLFLTSSQNLSAVNFTVSGNDVQGNPITPEVIAGPNAASVETTARFATNISIVPDADGGVADRISVQAGLSARTNWLGIDSFQTTIPFAGASVDANVGNAFTVKAYQTLDPLFTLNALGQFVGVPIGSIAQFEFTAGGGGGPPSTTPPLLYGQAPLAANAWYFDLVTTQAADSAMVTLFQPGLMGA